MSEPTKIIVLPNGATLIITPDDRTAEDWRQAFLAAWQDSGNHKTLVVGDTSVEITDLRREGRP